MSKRQSDQNFKTVFVRFEDDFISSAIPIKIRNNDLTVGWLFSEVGRQYHWYVEHANWKGFRVGKWMLVGLKTEEGISTMDYYLTIMEK